MRIISKKALDEFTKIHPAAKQPLARWYGIVKKAKFLNFNEETMMTEMLEETKTCWMKAEKFGSSY